MHWGSWPSLIITVRASNTAHRVRHSVMAVRTHNCRTEDKGVSLSIIQRRARTKARELFANVKSSTWSSKLYRRVGESPGRVPRLNEKGLVLPSNKKNWNTFPLQGMPNTGTRSPCNVLFQQQATTLTYGQNRCKLLMKRTAIDPNASK